MKNFILFIFSTATLLFYIPSTTEEITCKEVFESNSPTNDSTEQQALIENYTHYQDIMNRPLSFALMGLEPDHHFRVLKTLEELGRYGLHTFKDVNKKVYEIVYNRILHLAENSEDEELKKKAREVLDHHKQLMGDYKQVIKV